MRGAVPLALSFNVVQVIPTLHGLTEATASSLAQNSQSIVFIVVILNLLVQGLSLPVLCRVGDEVRAACGRLAGQPLCGLGTPLGKLAGRQWWLINSI